MTEPQGLLFQAVADPTRRGLFERLCRDGELSVGALTVGSGVSQPAVSRHLAVLARAGLVHGRAEGRHALYRAEPAALAPLAGWTRAMTDVWEARLDALGDLLGRMDR